MILEAIEEMRRVEKFFLCFVWPSELSSGIENIPHGTMLDKGIKWNSANKSQSFN